MLCPSRHVLLCVLSLGALVACSPRPSAAPRDPVPTDAFVESLPLGTLAPHEPQSMLPVEADDATWGSATARVTVVGFFDFECQFCKEGYGNLLQIRREYSEDDVRIVFKHMPLPTHELAIPSAVVGQAIMMEKGAGAFFEFAGMAFSRQASIGYESLAEWAGKVGLERQTYNRVVGEEEMMHRVGSDVLLARRLSVETTPTFFINGKVMSGAQPIELLRKEIHIELDAMQDAVGTKWSGAYKARLEKNMKVSLVKSLLSQDPGNYRVPVGNSPIDGPKDAPITMVAFSDFECPFCKQAEETVRALRTKYPTELRVVFKQLPLPFHDSARPAARLSVQVARLKGDRAFFAVSNDLFASSPTLDDATLRAIGRKHGLSSSEIEEALKPGDDALDQTIKLDEQLADDVLARGTPHFFINGKRLSGARPMEHFEALIEHELVNAHQELKGGVAPSELYEHVQRDAVSPGKPEKVDVAISAAGQPTRGPENAPIVVHVFSDFECPYCRQGEQLLTKLEADYPGKLRFVWHDFPLPFHKQALPAARAARQAFMERGNEGFWQMHHKLFALQGDGAKVDDEQIIAHAKDLGLNVEQIKQAMASNRFDAAIEKDQALAADLGINGTPAFVIGGYLVSGAGPEQRFRRVIDLALSEIIPVPAGTKGALPR